MNNKKLKFNKRHRHFSEEVRKSIVKEVDSGLAVSEASRKYDVSSASIYNWLNLYSKTYQKSIKTIVTQKSKNNKYKDLEKELKQVYELLGRTQSELNFANKIIELASEELDLDLKKSFDSSPSSISMNQIKEKRK